MVQITPQKIFTTRWNNDYPHQNFLTHPSPHWDGRFLPYTPLKMFEKPSCFNFPLKGVEIITYFWFDLYFFLDLKFDTYVSLLKMLLVIGNGLLISRWKYWIWISKNESILRTTVWKGYWLLFYPKLCVSCHFVPVRKNSN